VELREDFLQGALGRFERPSALEQDSMFDLGIGCGNVTYKIHHPGLIWNGHEEPLPEDGGKKRILNARNSG
jgi:hypothetical protein